MAAKWLAGTSGFVYDHWRGRFYPGKLADSAAGLKEIYIYFNNDTEGFAANNATNSVVCCKQVKFEVAWPLQRLCHLFIGLKPD